MFSKIRAPQTNTHQMIYLHQCRSEHHSMISKAISWANVYQHNGLYYLPYIQRIISHSGKCTRAPLRRISLSAALMERIFHHSSIQNLLSLLRAPVNTMGERSKRFLRFCKHFLHRFARGSITKLK